MVVTTCWPVVRSATFSSGGHRGDSKVPGSDGVDTLIGGPGDGRFKGDSADAIAFDSGDVTRADVFECYRPGLMRFRRPECLLCSLELVASD